MHPGRQQETSRTKVTYHASPQHLVSIQMRHCPGERHCGRCVPGNKCVQQVRQRHILALGGGIQYVIITGIHELRTGSLFAASSAGGPPRRAILNLVEQIPISPPDAVAPSGGLGDPSVRGGCFDDRWVFLGTRSTVVGFPWRGSRLFESGRIGQKLRRIWWRL